MKTRFIKNILPVAASALLLAGCTGDFESTNTNPNKITVNSDKLSASALFEPILYGGTNYLTYISYYWNDELIQHTAGTGYTTSTQHRYSIGDANWTSLWNGLARYGSDIHEMNRLATAQNDEAVQAVSRTLYVLYMQNLTDMFGDIPYSEAYQGTDGNMKPVYDSQEKVYAEMCACLEQANKMYAESPYVNSSYPALDAMYGFDMAKWRKFNNTLYLRLLGRLTNRTATIVDSTANLNVAQKMQQIVDNPSTYPVFESNADNATVHYSAVAPYYSEFDPQTNSDADFQQYRLTQQMIKMMVIKDPNNETVDTYVDPRLPIIGVKRDKYTYWKGTVSGGLAENQSTDDKGASLLNLQTLRRNNSDEFLMGYDEMLFILAEAAERGMISGGEEKARQYYEAAVKANIEKWSAFAKASVTTGTVPAEYDVTDDQINEFLQSALASWDLNTDHLKLIVDQKYIATFWVGMESWNDYRRTGYPELTIGAGTDPNDYTLPTRMGYPNTSVATNAEHVAEALKRMGGENNMKTPVWWSKQAAQGK
jgi:hypothetical protein